MKRLFILISILVSSHAWAATYYVRTDGHDTNCNGTADASSASAPNCAWLTLGKAESSVSGSHTIIVGNGTYAENLVIDANGTDADNLLTFQAQNSNQAIINGYVSLAGDYIKFDGFNVIKQDSQDVTVYVGGDYNTFTNCNLSIKSDWTPSPLTNYGISITGSHNTVSGCYITDGCQGVSINGDYNTLTNTEIDRLKGYSPSCGDVDFVRVFGTGHTASNNYLHGILADELGGVEAHVDGFQTFDNGGQILKNCIFENNRIIDTYNSCFILTNSTYQSSESTGNIIRNNACVTTGNWGVDARYVGYEAYNNTFIIDGSGYFFYLDTLGTHTNKVKNNIMVDVRADSISPTSYTCRGEMGTDCTNNISYAVYDNDRYSAVTYFADVVNTDPKLISYTSPYNLALQSDSPAINAGVDLSSTGFTADLLGVTRSNWDVGAYEYGSGDPTPGSMTGGGAGSVSGGGSGSMSGN
jgi:hypothetical protein